MLSSISSIKTNNILNLGFGSKKKKKKTEPNEPEKASQLRPADRALQGQMRGLCRNNPSLFDQLSAICGLPQNQQAGALTRLINSLEHKPSIPTTKSTGSVQAIMPGTKPSQRQLHKISINSPKQKQRAKLLSQAAKASGKTAEELNRMSNADLKALIQTQSSKHKRSKLIRPIDDEPASPSTTELTYPGLFPPGGSQKRPIPTVEAPKKIPRNRIEDGTTITTATTTDPQTGEVKVRHIKLTSPQKNAQLLTTELSRLNGNLPLEPDIQQLVQQITVDQHNLELISQTHSDEPNLILAHKSTLTFRQNQLKTLLRQKGLSIPPSLSF